MRDTTMKPSYWLKFTHYECVLCGRETIYRERVYDKPKPTEYHLRHVVRLDACGEHFA